MCDISFFTLKRDMLKKDFDDAKNRDTKERLEIIEKILEENNTEEEFLFEFLKLKQIIQGEKDNKGDENTNIDKDFLGYLKKYQVGINKEYFNKNFGNYFLKNSSYEKIIELFNKLRGIIKENTKDEQLIKIIELIEMDNEKYEQNFPISYARNKELYFNSLLYMLIKQINKNYLEEEKKLMELSQDEIDNEKSKYENKKEDIKNSKHLTESEKKEKIKGIDKILFHFSLCLYNNFYDYIIEMAGFINGIYSDFEGKFKSNDIFTTIEYKNSQRNDIYLFTDFIFFLIRFNFSVDSKIGIYKVIWKETFSPKIREKKDFISQDLLLKYDNNDLIIVPQQTAAGKQVEDKIENIDNYIDGFVEEIKLFNNKIDCFQKINFLKMDKYYSSIFIKSNWNVLSDYITDILLSPTLKEIYKSLYSDKKQFVPLKREDIKQIMDDFHFFNFSTDSVAETKKRFLSIHIQASFTSEKNYSVDIKKAIYLVIFLISCIHEIIGHLYIRINNYIYKDDKFSSPMPNFPSDYTEERQKESGEFIEESLFGNYQFKMTMKEILFTLDKANYMNGLSAFRTNFKNANKRKINSISNELKVVLDLYGINIGNLNYDTKIKYPVNKSKNEQKYIFPQHHSIKQIDSDDD